MSFGVNPSGFELKTLQDILASIRAKQKAAFGPGFVNELDTSVAGQLNGVVAGEIADLWLLFQDTWASFFPQTSEGASLDLLGQITGATRQPSTRSTVTLTISGTNGTIISAGFQAGIPNSSVRFETISSATISGGSATVDAQAIEFGPIVAAAGSLTQIVTPVAGVSAVTNAADAAVGRNVESDAEFRLRRALLLQASGAATLDAIRSAVLNLEDVLEVVMFENTTMAVDGDGLPAKSFETVVLGGDDQQVVDAIGKNKPAGIEAYGNASGTYTGEDGVGRTIGYSRPIDVDIYVAATFTTNGNYPVGGDALLKQAIVNYWNALKPTIGRDVFANQLAVVFYTFPGVEFVSSITVGIAPAPVGASVAIASRERGVLETTRISF